MGWRRKSMALLVSRWEKVHATKNKTMLCSLKKIHRKINDSLTKWIDQWSCARISLAVGLIKRCFAQKAVEKMAKTSVTTKDIDDGSDKLDKHSPLIPCENYPELHYLPRISNTLSLRYNPWRSSRGHASSFLHVHEQPKKR